MHVFILHHPLGKQVYGHRFIRQPFNIFLNVIMEEIYLDIFKLFLAIVIGSVIGYEREKKDKPVGVRTLSLVCAGSAFVTMLALKYFPFDTGRVIAGIITGIGFLGAGAIITEGSGAKVRGMTTAASIWAISIAGIAIGLGEVVLTAVFTVVVYAILVLSRLLSTAQEKILKKL